MSIRHAVVLHIADKILSSKDLEDFVQLLVSKHNFSLLGGPSFGANKTHLGTTFLKNVTRDTTEDIFETVKTELENIDTGKRIACRLNVSAINNISDGLFI